MPSEVGRKKLFEISLKQLKVDEKIDWSYLVKHTEGYSGADITNVCREASLIPFRKLLAQYNDMETITQKQDELNIPLTMSEFTQALKNISKSVGNEFLGKYGKWMKCFGST